MKTTKQLFWNNITVFTVFFDQINAALSSIRDFKKK